MTECSANIDPDTLEFNLEDFNVRNYLPKVRYTFKTKTKEEVHRAFSLSLFPSSTSADDRLERLFRGKAAFERQGSSSEKSKSLAGGRQRPNAVRRAI